MCKKCVEICFKFNHGASYKIWKSQLKKAVLKLVFYKFTRNRFICRTICKKQTLARFWVLYFIHYLISLLWQMFENDMAFIWLSFTFYFNPYSTVPILIFTAVLRIVLINFFASVLRYTLVLINIIYKDFKSNFNTF